METPVTGSCPQPGWQHGTHHAIGDVNVQCPLLLQKRQHRAEEVGRDGQLGVGVVTHRGQLWHPRPGGYRRSPQWVIDELTSGLPNQSLWEQRRATQGDKDPGGGLKEKG